MKKSHLALWIGLSAFAFISCDKTESLTALQTENTSLISEDQAVEVASTDVDAIADEALTLKSQTTLRAATAATDSSNYVGTCATLTLDTTKLVKTLTVDFGTACVGKDGKTRSGKIVISALSFSKLNVERTISFQNYIVNGDTVTGSIKKTFTTVLSLYKRKAHIIEDVTVKRGLNKGTVTRNANMYRVYDFDRLLLVRDDKIYIWGTATFTNAKGAVITKTISDTTPLIYRVLCRRVVKGIQVVTRGGKTYTTDFGDGTCDSPVTITDGTNSWTTKL